MLSTSSMVTVMVKVRAGLGLGLGLSSSVLMDSGYAHVTRIYSRLGLLSVVIVPGPLQKVAQFAFCRPVWQHRGWRRDACMCYALAASSHLPHQFQQQAGGE